LGYGLVSPRADMNMSDILETLPEPVRRRFERTEEELRAEIEERIHAII